MDKIAESQELITENANHLEVVHKHNGQIHLTYHPSTTTWAAGSWRCCGRQSYESGCATQIIDSPSKPAPQHTTPTSPISETGNPLLRDVEVIVRGAIPFPVPHSSPPTSLPTSPLPLSPVPLLPLAPVSPLSPVLLLPLSPVLTIASPLAPLPALGYYFPFGIGG